ncbi:MAG: penicillin-binding protein 2 [Mariprofundales bacterium]|nr:penicillin-binding protein 2 [Mariprofundales bacterium]
MDAQLQLRADFNRRVMIAGIGMLILLLLLCARLLYLQWMQHEGLLLQSNQNRMDMVPELPIRGNIVDRKGRIVAGNRLSYSLALIPERVEKMEMTLQFIARQLQWSPAQIRRIRNRIARSRPDRPVLLQDKLRWQQAAPIASRQHHWPGIQVTAASYRYYPYGALTAHLVGYLAMARSADLQSGYHSGESIGRSGMERTMEQQLRGVPGYRIEEVDSHGSRSRTLLRTPPVDGKSVRLSIDIDLQQAAATALGDRMGAVVVIDVHSGEVLTLLSQPGFDSNKFITGLTTKQWQLWLHDPHKPLLNRAIQAAYPPASTMKLITALSGLKYNRSLIRSTDLCRGYIELSDRKLRCWKKGGHGNINLTNAITESCDVYFYHLGEQLGMEKMRKSALEWGLAQPTGIELATEVRGHFPGVDASASRRRWYQGETMITAIGQGSVTTTPIQIARLAAAIANQGQVRTTTLIAGHHTSILYKPSITAHDLRLVQYAMHRVVTVWGGTARHAFAGALLSAAGKTGTAEVMHTARDRHGKRVNKQVGFYQRDHAWFMGYAPFETPRIAFAVLVEHGGHGGHAAAPVARAVVDAFARHYMAGKDSG